jgi:hypothetical protein
MLIPDPKTPHRSAPARTGRGRHVEKHAGGIQRLAGERLAGGFPSLVRAPLAPYGRGNTLPALSRGRP